MRLPPRTLPIIDRLAPSPVSTNRFTVAPTDHRRPLRCNATATTKRMPTVIITNRMISGPHPGAPLLPPRHGGGRDG